ncbi:glycine--tRNA ligase subunit beta [Candidatus Omnitrophota bacterium]
MKNKVRDFLLEICVEELPASYVRPALYSLQQGFLEHFKTLRVAHGEVYTAGTANELVCYVKDVLEWPEPLTRDIKGPPKKIALDEKGNWTKQGIGFAKSQGVALEDLKIEPTKEGEYVFRKAKTVKGKPTKEYLVESIIPELIKNIHFLKTMKWDSSGLRFARPIEKLLAFFGKESLPVKLGKIPAKKIHMLSSEACLKDIQKKYLIDPNKRKEKIRFFIKGATKTLKADFYIDENLLEEVTFMVGSPGVFVGWFDKKFLSLPEDVLKASMAKHQRIFPVLKKSKLINKFIAVIDGKGRDIKSMRRNYENILEAKLKDSLFFFDEDTKKPFSENVSQLKDLIFQKDLGSMFEKIERLKELCSFICDRLGKGGSLKINTERAAELSKADLVTHMVGEFPSLQGVIGREYALKNGEAKDVAAAIGEHYLPQGTDDSLPKTTEGAILAISDKIDNLVGFCGVNIEKISGSFDPFGIRRNALGLIRIIEKKSFVLMLDELIEKAIELYGAKINVDAVKFKQQTVGYIKDRIDFLMGDVRPLELKRAVLDSGSFDIAQIFKRKKALMEIRKEKYFLEAAKVVERTSNILKGAKKEKIGEVDESLFKEDLERAVWKAYLDSKGKIQDLISKEKYKEATKEYAQAFFKVLHDFFDKVLVNVDNGTLRLNRLAMMKTINRLYAESVADLALLPQIVVK